MEELLLKYGIDSFDDAIYEYASSALDWWDGENRTSIEIDIQQIEDGLTSLNVIFCPDDEGVVERINVFASSFNGKKIQKNALVAKVVFENINCELELPFSDEQNAYFTTKATESELVLACILNLIEQKKPIYQADLSKPNYEERPSDNEEIQYEVGDTLDHFIAMMYINSAECIKEHIIAVINMVTEDDQYLDRLKNDVTSGKKFDFEELYEVNEEQLNLIKETILNYKQSNNLAE